MPRVLVPLKTGLCDGQEIISHERDAAGIRREDRGPRKRQDGQTCVIAATPSAENLPGSLTITMNILCYLYT